MNITYIYACVCVRITSVQLSTDNILKKCKKYKS